MRNYSNIDSYLSELSSDVYPQPPDDLHMELSAKVIGEYVVKTQDCNSVLDIGCGEGYVEYFFKFLEKSYTGIALGDDYVKAAALGRNVFEMDMHFLEFPDNEFDMIFSRHSLEHSPMPLLALMEWHRVAKNWLCLVVPNPEHYGWIGRNHYSVMNTQQLSWLLRRSGWKIDKKKRTDTEFWALCSKEPRVSSEGWILELDNPTYESDRNEWELE